MQQRRVQSSHCCWENYVIRGTCHPYFSSASQVEVREAERVQCVDLGSVGVGLHPTALLEGSKVRKGTGSFLSELQCLLFNCSQFEGRIISHFLVLKKTLYVHLTRIIK